MSLIQRLGCVKFEMSNCDSSAERAVTAGVKKDFRTTHWSAIASVGKSGPLESQAALEALCRTYWYPVYAFVRRRGYALHEAQDLTQTFFCEFLANEGFQTSDRSKGRFRSYLVGALKNFLANEWDRAHRVKRGGGRVILSWDELNPEERFQNEPVEDLPADQLLDREWAHAVAAAALSRLRAESVKDGTQDRFEKLKQYLGAGGVADSYAEVAETLDLSESAIKSAIHRLRRRFAELFRAEVRETVASAEDAELEIRHLFAAWNS